LSATFRAEVTPAVVFSVPPPNVTLPEAAPRLLSFEMLKTPALSVVPPA